jgi:hypothetical protein
LLLGLSGCASLQPFIVFLGVPSSIIQGNSITVTAQGQIAPGVNNVPTSVWWTFTFSSTCGGTFSTTVTPNNGPANPLIVGPSNISNLSGTNSVTYNSTGATLGPCTLSVTLKDASVSNGQSATASVNITIITVITVGFIDDFEDGNYDGWYNWNAQSNRHMNDGEWSVVQLGATKWLQHKYDGGCCPGHTDWNLFLTNERVLNLDVDFTLEVKAQYTGFGNVGFGILYVPREDIIIDASTTTWTPVDAIPPRILGVIGTENDVFIFPGQTIDIPHLATDSPVTIKVVKTGNTYNGFIDGNLIATTVVAPSQYTSGSYKLALQSRGYFGTSSWALYDYVRLTYP